MIRFALVATVSALLIAGCGEDDKPTTGYVRLTNAMAIRDITYFKYKSHDVLSWSGAPDLIATGSFLPAGGSHDFELPCGVRFDFAAGSYAGLFGEVQFTDHVVPCGGRLELRVTD